MHYVQPATHLIQSDAAAIEAIAEIKKATGEPCITIREKKDDEPASKAAKKARMRRDAQRDLCEQLSRFYPLDQGKVWSRSKLFLTCKDIRLQYTGGILLICFSGQC